MIIEPLKTNLLIHRPLCFNREIYNVLQAECQYEFELYGKGPFDKLVSTRYIFIEN